MAGPTVPMRDYIDARINEVSASNDAIHSEVRSGLEVLATEVRGGRESVNIQLASVPKMWQLIVLIVGAAAGVLAILLGILAFGGDRFDGGVTLSASSIEQSAVAKRIAEENSEKLDALSESVNNQFEKANVQWDRLENILPALEALAEKTKATEQSAPQLDQ
jgi:hypothetical protein